ncbi:isoflavone 4'-O-methyltransferase-like [Neltuma alba]|uniref:isoflavone 4'-O-methyltransferase-like n=1 Tax=Neltuma alba TaxID=207710 RepID=UPI0010A3E9D4|nr:isoflavone 4'-O-methyltransferase-like [Prosopis alba]
MDSRGAGELFQAQSHLYKLIFSFISTMSLKTAINLGIPDIIHSHGQPITLPKLVLALQIDPAKSGFLYRLMRFLVHSGLFLKTKVDKGGKEEEEEAYDLSPCSRLLVNGNAPNLTCFAQSVFHPALSDPWKLLGDWFYREEQNPFHCTYGIGFWEYGSQDPEYGKLYNEAMVSDSGMMNLVIRDCRSVFEGMQSMVDVGGGKGAVARIISEEFPNMKCTVLDLPHVIEDLQDTENLKFVAGDMFHHIPPADSILLKLVLHAYSDEDCVRILEKSREAISGKGKEGKVMIIDIVINEKEDKPELTDPKLYFDLLMMVAVTGREREEREWKKLFLEAGFSGYKITPIFGLRSLLEVYP